MKDKLYLTFRALRHKNYLLFFVGQCISLIGTWIQQIAISWLVYRLTNSALLMGIITFVGAVPSLFIAPFAGVIIDRINKYKMLTILQIIFMIEALILSILTLTGTIQIWSLIFIGALVGITSAIDMPLRQAFVVQLVEDNNDLGNAISLNSSIFNLARIIGPAIAGILIASVGEGICFLLNSLSYIAVITALLAMTIKNNDDKKKESKNALKELVEGFRYAFGIKTIRNALSYLAISSFIGMAFQVLMPIYAKEILGGNSQTLGILMSASGLGALIGALHLASRRTSAGLEQRMFTASLLFSLAVIGLSYTKTIWLAMLLLFITGFGMVTIMAASNTLIQDCVDESKRGRVMSLYTMAFIGTAPLGSLFEGSLADKIGLPYTFLINGLVMLISALAFNAKLKYNENQLQENNDPKTIIYSDANVT